jgi:hypothetical protein
VKIGLMDLAFDILSKKLQKLCLSAFYSTSNKLALACNADCRYLVVL